MLLGPCGMCCFLCGVGVGMCLLGSYCLRVSVVFVFVHLCLVYWHVCCLSGVGVGVRCLVVWCVSCIGVSAWLV